MIQNLYKRKTGVASGFTIIEVMIVLAIAGLIMLIVFLAVPALQRNAHNTSIKNDVSSVLAGVNEYINNNNGQVPTGINPATRAVNSIDIWGGAGTNSANVKVGYVDGTSTTKVTLTAASGNVKNNFPAGDLHVYTGALCAGNDLVTSTATSTATARDVVVLYGLEGGAEECQAS